MARLEAIDSRYRRAAAGVIAILAAAAAVGTALPASTGLDTTAQRLRACVDRWNWMHYDGMFGDRRHTSIPARVQAGPCSIEVAYRPRAEGNRPFLSAYFPCRLNRFGAYDCAEHAHGLPADPPRRDHNARYSVRSGRIRLDQPPARPVATPMPGWVRRYAVDHGFIVPFDGRGRLRAGIVLGKRSELTCQTFAGIRHRSRLLACGAGLYCFVPRLPVRHQARLACPSARGSRLFYKGRLRVLS